MPCLDTHDPIDLVILMLGTNELKAKYQKSANNVGEMLEEYFVKTILNRKSQLKDSCPKLLIVVPPIVNENQEYCKTNNMFLGASQKSKELNDIYKNIAKKYNCYFLSNQGLETGIDGVHLTKESHMKLAKNIEKNLGKTVISNKNSLNYEYIDEKLLEEKN